MKKSYWIFLFGIVIVFTNCGILTNNDDGIIKVDFPNNKTSVYISVMYIEIDSLILSNIEVVSIEYDSIYIHKDTTFYIGTTNEYQKDLDEDDSEANYKSGIIKTSRDNNWINNQYYDSGNAIFISFLKPIATSIDTSLEPANEKWQFSAYPSKLEPNQTYSIYRPRGYGINFGYTKNYRTDGFIDWSDNYGDGTGIEIELLSSNEDLSIKGIIDKHGLIISQRSFFNQIMMNENGDVIDTVNSYIINRRIEDFSDPDDIHDLSHYYNLVLEDELNFIDPVQK